MTEWSLPKGSGPFKYFKDGATLAQVIELSLGDYAGIRQEYRARIYSEIVDFLAGGANRRTKTNAAKRAITEAFGPTADMAYKDGGGELPMDSEDNEWFNSRVELEYANIEALFAQLAQTRKDPDFIKSEAHEIGNTRADGYAATLDGIYNESKMRGAGNMMINFGGQDGHGPEFPCATCKRLKGRDRRHRASWYIKRGLIPYPGNPNFACGAWQCRHFFSTDAGDLFTI